MNDSTKDKIIAGGFFALFSGFLIVNAFLIYNVICHPVALVGDIAISVLMTVSLYFNVKGFILTYKLFNLAKEFENYEEEFRRNLRHDT